MTTTDVTLLTLGGDEVSVGASRIAELGSRLRGDLLAPGHADYEQARLVWNGMIDRRPALIARCRDVEDVVAAVRFADEHELPVAVRGGGHGVAGHAVVDGGLVVDLSPMRSVEVDPAARTARAGGGSRLADVDRATQAHGLAAPLGVVSRTGIAGLTLSGGIGWLRRAYGLTCDNLLAAQVVTAGGRVVTAGGDGDPELLWALRGGGGNFGVVTSFEYRLHPVGPEIMVAFVLYPGERAAEVIEFCASYTATAPEAVSPLCFVGRVPRTEAFPEEAHGLPYAALAAVHPGDPAEGASVLQPLRELGRPIVDLSGPMRYTEAQTLLDEDYPDGWRYYWKSVELDELSPDVVRRVLAHAAAAPSDHSTVDVWCNGGAMGRVPADATAFGARPAVLLGYEANFEDAAAADENVAWVRDSIDELRPFSTGGAYLNFPGFFEEGDELLRASFGEANYARLVAVKNALDPANVFRFNGNIAPTA
ncbi:MAG TPA: FAD-binding oxidoreductase [Gaiellaceae bacterium]|nr:FAD-binding oxidoreductase [Gaiellaceae bacterium]